MRRVLTTLLLVAGLNVGPARADPDAIQGVIGDQLDAFQADDFARAFTHAAPSIRGMFGDPQRFGTMVRQGYPMVWRPGSVEYLGTEDRGGTWEQQLLVGDGSGRLHVLAYTMVETPEGWKIAGVRILEEPEVGA